MSYTYELRQEAAIEFTKSYVWYEEQQDGLGEKFTAAFYDKLDHICRNPYHYKSIYKKYHEALTDKFPFSIVYQVIEKEQRVIVIAIFHTSRNPKRKIRKK